MKTLSQLHDAIGKEELEALNAKLDLFKHPSGIEKFIQLGTLRVNIIKDFSFALPTASAIKTLAELSPLIEIGAGTGFWAKLIEEEGGNITAFDMYPPNEVSNHYGFNKCFTDVKKGGPEKLSNFDAHNLFLCWPPYERDMALDCISNKGWKGKYLIYIGEYFGCTANEEFHRELALSWRQIKTIHIPQWPGIHDKMYIYERQTQKHEQIPTARACSKDKA